MGCESGCQSGLVHSPWRLRSEDNSALSATQVAGRLRRFLLPGMRDDAALPPTKSSRSSTRSRRPDGAPTGTRCREASRPISKRDGIARSLAGSSMTTSGAPWEIVHCVHSVAIGGQEVVILSLAAHTDRTRFTPRVLCFEGAGELEDRFASADIPVDVLDRPEASGARATLMAVRRYLRRRRPAILHTHNPTPHQFGALARLGTGVPVLVHTKHGRNRSLSARRQCLEIVAGRLTDAVVAVSTDAADVARTLDHVPPDRIHVIHNGVDIAEFAPRPGGSRAWRVVHVGRLSGVKDQATLLRAARIVLDHEPRFRLELVGDGEARASLEHLAAELQLGSAVTFHGFHADVRPFLADADLFVLSSRSEGIAITLLEAMAAAVPVVATDVGGNREVVVPDVTGLLVPAGDPSALAAAMSQLLGNPARASSMGAAGRQRVGAHFDLQTTVAAYESLYLALLQRRRGGRHA